MARVHVCVPRWAPFFGVFVGSELVVYVVGSHV